MARFTCPQCGRGFGSVSEMLNHTQRDHAGEETTTIGASTGAPSRSMPGAEPGRVATERASEAEFETEVGGNGGATRAGGGGEAEQEKQNPTTGTLIALVVIAIIIILNIIGGGGGE